MVITSYFLVSDYRSLSLDSLTTTTVCFAFIGQTIKMILFLIGLLGFLLQVPTAPAKDYHLDFKKMCRLYPDFTIDAFGHIDEYGMNTEMLFEVRDLIRDLSKQGLDWESLHNSMLSESGHCFHASNLLKTECLFIRRFQILFENRDFEDEWDLDTVVADVYKDLWLLHPVWRGCAKQLKKPPAKNDAKARFLRGLAGSKVKKYAMILPRKDKTMIRKEIEKSCGEKGEDKVFCSGLDDLMKLVDTYGAVKHENRNGGKWKAYRMHFAMLRHNQPKQYGSAISLKTANDIISTNMEQILTYTKYREKTKMNEMFSVMPELPGNTNCKDLSSIASSSKIVCIFWKTVNLVRDFLQAKLPMQNGPVKVILNTQIDYPAFLKFTEMNEILSVIQRQSRAMIQLAQWVTREVKKDVNDRFLGLRSYFQKVAKFNRDTSKADIDFIKGRLDIYKTDVTKLNIDLSRDLGRIINDAIVAVGKYQ